MCSTSSAESAASASDLNEPECEPSPSARSTIRRRVLAKHWPNVPSITTSERLPGSTASEQMALPLMSSAEASPARTSAIAGKGAGIDGERSGLWSEYARIIGEVRPRYVIVENVAALLGRGLDRVLGDLAALGLMRSGTAYQLPPLVRLTDATDLDCGLPRSSPKSADHWRSNHAL
jgi:hypothetical protein